MLKIVQKLFGTSNDRYLSRIRPEIEHINSLEPLFEKMSETELRGMTAKLKTKLDNGASLDDIARKPLQRAREASRRTLKMRHYDVQLIGNMVLHPGKIAEMKTGEGKTLVATSPLYLNALSGKGAHLITVNDYLAKRDAEWMGNIYRYLGLTVGTIVGEMDEYEKRAAYHSDITYGTNNEFGFDYLRDNMKFSLESMVQNELNFAIVDEVDSILIDEARTPLIISGAAGLSTELPFTVNQFVPFLKRDEDYLVDEEHRSVSLTDLGVEKIEKRMNIDNLYEPANIEVVHAVVKALQAHTLYKRDDRYIVRDNEVIIVDEFTGRPMPGRRWSDGLHQAIEAKEGVRIQDENQTLATVTFQNFFRMYDKLAGMTGTAETEAEEFHSIYKLETIVIPTNRPIQRLDEEDVVYRSYREKFQAIVDTIVDAHSHGQPVLVGTTSVEKSEAISHVLKKKGVEHHVLNAKHHGKEAGIVAQAGRYGAVTIATNMAGRGTDILLGGSPEGLAEAEVGPQDVPITAIGEEERAKYYTPEYTEALARHRATCTEERQRVLEAGGLYIIGTERHESRRIDNQLRGRAGRQGDVGRSRFYLSLEDDLLRLFGGDRIARVMDTLKMEDGVPIEHPMVTRSLENAQKKVEGRNFDIRKNVLEYDDVMDMQRKTIYGLRKNVLKGVDVEGRTLYDMALDLFEEIALSTINIYASRSIRAEDWDIESLKFALREIFGVDFEFPNASGRDEIEKVVWTKVKGIFDEKVAMLDSVAKRINDNKADNAAGGDWDTDDKEVTAKSLFEEQIQEQYLRAIDRYWRQHLQAMEQLRDGIGMRGYAQKDPKQEYKKEGYNLFLDLLMNIKTNVVKFIAQFQVTSAASLAQPAHNVPKQIVLNRTEAPAEEEEAPQDIKRELPKIGRNDPCPCGSGKKYKNCHMKADDDEAAAS
ncbi:MAG: preprotein translocase subunit SecA [bacterium]